MEREGAREEAERLFRESTERLEKVREKHKAFQFLVDVAGSEMEAAYDAYMEADTEESWQEFELHAEHACFSFRCAILDLHKLAEVVPSMVDPQVMREIELIIDKINNLRIGYWQNWGKRVKAEREAGRRPTGKLVCPALLYYMGIDDMANMGIEGIDFCLHKCPYADRCDPTPKC